MIYCSKIIAIFMRVLFCKSHCPSFSFPKSPLFIYSSCSLKLEDAHHVSSSTVPIYPALEDKSSKVMSDVMEKESGIKKIDFLRKSILKKQSGGGNEVVGKGRVKWMDFVGKELAEIREFDTLEPRKLQVIGSARSQTCICSIQ